MSDIAATSNDVVAAAARPVAPSTPRGGGKAGAIFESIQGFTSQPAVAKSLPAIGFLGGRAENAGGIC